MTRRLRLALAVLAWTIIGLLTVLVTYSDAEAAPACPGLALVQVQSGFALNVRAQSGGVSQILSSVTERDGELRIVEERTGFLRLETGGWIINKYLSILCWELGMPVPTSSPTATATRPVVIMTQTPRATPTRIAMQLIYCATQPEIVEVETGLWRVVCNYL